VEDQYGVVPHATAPAEARAGTVTPQAAQAHAMSSPGTMVDATGMDAAAMTGATTSARATAPPGWYADPELPGAMRYWSGAAWAPSGAAAPGAAAPSAP
jgi:hypothetical protein